MNLEGIDRIGARHGSISPARLYQAGGAIERLVSEDVPALLNVARLASDLLFEYDIPEAKELLEAIKKLGKK